jgi:hypothetical protein
MRHQLLVGGDHRLAGEQRRADPLVRRPQPSNQLDDDVHVRRDHFVRRFAPGHRCRDPVDALARDIPVIDVRQLDLRHFAAAQDARHGLPHGAETEQRDAGNRNGIRGLHGQEELQSRGLSITGSAGAAHPETR